MWGMGFWAPGGRPSREELLRALEEYQKDLEEELADVASKIERLKKQAEKA